MADSLRRLIRDTRRQLAHSRTTLKLVALQQRHRALEREADRLRRRLAQARAEIQALRREGGTPS